MLIPNLADAEDPTQSQPDARDFGDILAPGAGLTGVCFGCAVTAQASPNMTLAVAAGLVLVTGRAAVVTAGNVTITTADATNTRFDLVVVDNLGNKTVVAGTPAAIPVFPSPAGKVVLAAVRVPPAASSINAAKLVDKRVVFGQPGFNMLKGGGCYYAPMGVSNLIAFTLNRITTIPVWLPGGITVDRLGIDVTTAVASSFYRLGLYNDSGFGYPGALLIDAGQVDTSTTGGKEATISQVIQSAGWYWLAAGPQGAVATVRTLSSPSNAPMLWYNSTSPPTNVGTRFFYCQDGVSGGLNASMGVGTYAQDAPRVYFRVT